MIPKQFSLSVVNSIRVLWQQTIGDHKKTNSPNEIIGQIDYDYL